MRSKPVLVLFAEIVASNATSEIGLPSNIQNRRRDGQLQKKDD
jgi:hypothetical protein